MVKYHITNILSVFVLSSCAGPMNPFGATTVNMLLNDKTPGASRSISSTIKAQNDILQEDEIAKSQPVSITYFPERQNLHDTHDIFIIVNSKSVELNPNQLRVYWNHIDITESFQSIKDVFYSDKETMIVKLKDIRLLPFIDNDITTYYQTKKDNRIYTKNYKKPECGLNEQTNVAHTGSFKVKQSFLNSVEKISQDNKINPNFILALIAQESGFNPKSVSYAKAIGLTQVTELANVHIRKEHKTWKSDKRINSLPVPIIRAMIKMGKINERNEWRLDKKKSVIGGIEYIKYLVSYWDANSNLLEKVYGPNYNKEKIYTDLILASYNSGPYRIKSKLIQDGISWKSSETIMEARKYIGKIKSYCNYFSNINQEEEYERKTVNF